MTNEATVNVGKETDAAAENTRNVPVYVPATDIYETPQAIVVAADMPGVDEKHVDVNLENNVLTIVGHGAADDEGKRRLMCCGYQPGDYRRTFAISDDVNRNGIRAQMKNGVLRITLPKSEKLQPRKIAVEAQG